MKISCDCGSKITKKCFAKHLKSKKHKNRIRSQLKIRIIKILEYQQLFVV